MKRAWSCITLGSDRQYGGNSGYKDDLSRHYEYDSNVANHRNVSEGDLIVLRDRARGIGVAQIAKIETASGHKLINRCPECGTTGIKARKSKSPLYRCNSGHEFDVPRSADEPVTIYRALFESFLALQAPIPVARLKAMAPRQSDQLSIEELDLSELEAAFGSLGEPAARLSQAAAARSTIGTQEADDNSIFLAPMTSADLRNLVLRAIKVRRGQAKFRKDLLRRYGSLCLVTGCNVEALLEAAHIAPYRNDTHNQVENGLLLRADIHTLFDLNLITIEPMSLVVQIAPELRGTEYDVFHGRALLVANVRPAFVCLQERNRLLGIAKL